MSSYEPTVVARHGGWELVEGLSGRSLRRPPHRGPVQPRIVLGTLTIALGAWMHWTGAFSDGPAAAVVGFGIFILLFGARFRGRDANELRLGETELGWGKPREIGGMRWPHSELSHILILELLKPVSPGARRQRTQRPHLQVIVVKKDGDWLPAGFLLFDKQSAANLAALLADSTGLEVQTDTASPD